MNRQDFLKDPHVQEPHVYYAGPLPSMTSDELKEFWQKYNASYERCFGVSFNDTLKEMFSENGSEARVTD